MASRSAVADHEEVVVVVDQFVGGREPFPKRLTRGPDQSLRAGSNLSMNP
jgi:hypothetical protein